MDATYKLIINFKNSGKKGRVVNFRSSLLWLIISYLCITSLCINSLCFASHYGPSLLFHKPYSTEPALGSIFVNFCGGKTSQGYNRNGQIVPFLQEYGSEDLLRRFMDTTVSKDDTESLGKIAFAGTLGFERLNLAYSKNIHHHCFIGIGTVIQNLQVGDIKPTITLYKPLNPEDQKKLEILESKIPNSLNTSGMLTTAIEFGYNRIFDNFSSINFLQFFISGCIATPQVIHGHNLSILQYPLAGNISFAYPVTGIVTCGINQHLNLGAYGTIIPFQPKQITAPVNNTGTENTILLDHFTALTVYPKPVLSSVFYIEAHSFITNFMATFGYGSSWGIPWKVTARNQQKYPDPIINNNQLLNGWNLGSMFFQIDYSFRSEKHPYGPALSLSYVFPLAGRYFPKINILGAAFNLGLHYTF